MTVMIENEKMKNLMSKLKEKGFDEDSSFLKLFEEVFKEGRTSALDEVENELPVPRIGGMFSDNHVDGQFYYKERVKNFISRIRSETGSHD